MFENRGKHSWLNEFPFAEATPLRQQQMLCARPYTAIQPTGNVTCVKQNRVYLAQQTPRNKTFRSSGTVENMIILGSGNEDY